MAPPSLRFTILAALVMSSVAQAHSKKFRFPDCVDDCIRSNGCSTNNPKCMCRAAKGDFLISVVTCMSKHCTSRLISANSDFLDIMQEGCSSIDIPIPQDKLDEAEEVATSLTGKLPPITQTQPMTPIIPPKTTSAPQTTKSKATTTVRGTDRTETETSLASGGDSTTTPEPDPAVTVTASPDTLLGSQSTSTSSSPPSDPTDSSPFATPNGASNDLAPWLWAGVPFFAVLGLR